MDQLPDHYAALGISPQADQDVIAAAYRALLKKYHPDTGTLRGTASKERLAEVLDAFEVLGNPESRAAYDAERATRLAAPDDDDDDDDGPMALESRNLASWSPTLGPAGERPGSEPRPRRAAPWMWVILPVLLAGSAAAWLLSGEGVEPPPQPAEPEAPVAAAEEPQPAPVAEETPPAAAPPKKVQAPVAALPDAGPAQPSPEKAVAPPLPKPSAFILVMGQDGLGAESQGNIFFNTRKSCENFAARALERRRNAALNQSGTAPGIWYECRPVKR